MVVDSSIDSEDIRLTDVAIELTWPISLVMKIGHLPRTLPCFGATTLVPCIFVLFLFFYVWTKYIEIDYHFVHN